MPESRRSKADAASEPNRALGAIEAGPLETGPLEIGQLVSEHYDYVFRMAYRLTGSAADAEDVAQQTFLAAHRNLAQLREAAAVRGWLATILRNCFWKICRTRRPAAAESLDVDLDAVPTPAEPESVVDPERLQLALDRLPDEARLVLTMFYFQQLSYVEIAGELQIPLGTVMSRLARAKRRLRDLLAPHVVERTDRLNGNGDGNDDGASGERKATGVGRLNE